MRLFPLSDGCGLEDVFVKLPEELLTEIYGWKTEASLQERVDSMTNQELAWLMLLIAQKMSKQ